MFGRLAVQPLLLLCLIKWFLRWRSYSEFQWRQDLFHRCRARNRQSYVCPIIAMCFKSYCYHYFHDTSGISCIYSILCILSSKWFASRLKIWGFVIPNNSNIFVLETWNEFISNSCFSPVSDQLIYTVLISMYTYIHVGTDTQGLTQVHDHKYHAHTHSVSSHELGNKHTHSHTFATRLKRL